MQEKQKADRRERLEKVRKQKEEREAAEGGKPKEEDDDDADDIIDGADPFQSLKDHLSSKVSLLRSPWSKYRYCVQYSQWGSRDQRSLTMFAGVVALCYQHHTAWSKDSDYVCGSCGTLLSTPHNMCGVDNGVPQLLQT